MHIEINTLILFLEDKLSQEELAKVKTHLADCASCAEQLADIYKLENSIKNLQIPKIDKDVKVKAENIVKNNRVTNNRNSNYTSLKLALTGVFTVIIITVYFFFFNYNNSPSTFREIKNVENSIIIAPKNEALIKSNELNFKWKEIQNSIAYHFILYKDNGKLLWEKQSKKNSLTLPSSIKIENGKKYLWRVEIIFPDNSKKRSKLYVFTYKKQ